MHHQASGGRVTNDGRPVLSLLALDRVTRSSEHQTGLEPATFCLEGSHSTIELLMHEIAVLDFGIN